MLLTSEDKETLTEIFHAIDLDGDGRLSRDDLRHGFHEFGGDHSQISEHQLRKLFWRIGRHAEDVAGFVEYMEFIIGAVDKSNMMSSDSLQQAFTSLDADQNGFITASELKHVLPSHDGTVEKIIEKVDIDGDGMISFGEFLSMVFKCGKTDTQSKEKEWFKTLPKPRAPSILEVKKQPEREWKYKKNPNLRASMITAEDLLSPSKKQLPMNVLGELKGKIPHMGGLLTDDDDEKMPAMTRDSEDEQSDHDDNDRDMKPVPLPGNVMSQLKMAQSDLKSALHHVSETELAEYRNYKDIKVPFLDELKDAQESLTTYLKVVPDELKERPEIADRPYITELKKAQKTVLSDWREETYKYWI